MADDIRYLLVPGRGIPGPGHWLRRWAGARPDFRWAPEPPGPPFDLAERVKALHDAISADAAPALLIAHSAGCITVATWASRHRGPVRAAMLATPPFLPPGWTTGSDDPPGWTTGWDDPPGWTTGSDDPPGSTTGPDNPPGSTPGPDNPPGWTPGLDDPPDRVSFAVPRERLPFPTILVASRTDPYTSFEQFEQYAEDWGSELVDAGDAGHLETASGYGPWPAGEQLIETLVER